MNRLLVIVMGVVQFALACAHQTMPEEPSRVVLLTQHEATTQRRDSARFLSGLLPQGREFKAMSQALTARHWQEAMGLAKAYLQRHPYDRGALIVLATAHTGLRQYELASYYARTIQRRGKASPAALNILGLAQLAHAELMQDYRAALTLFQKAVQVDPHDIAAALNLGYLHLELGSAKHAAEVFAVALQRCGQCVEAATGQATALSRLGRAQEAKLILEGILVRYPQNEAALYQMALYYRNYEVDADKSAAFLQRLIELEKAQDVELKEKARSLLYSLK